MTDLHYVAHAVPDLAAERKFYGETWGLTEVGEQDGKVYFDILPAAIAVDQ